MIDAETIGRECYLTMVGNDIKLMEIGFGYQNFHYGKYARAVVFRIDDLVVDSGGDGYRFG